MYCILIILAILTLYSYGTRTFHYWKRKGVKHDFPLPFFGTNAKQFFQRATLGMVASDVYRRYPKEKVVGFYNGTSPVLIIRDPDIIKRILITDFQQFHARGYNFTFNEYDGCLMKNFFMSDGDLWRLQRQKFSPAFSSARLKAMFPIIAQRAEKLQELAEKVSGEKAYDMRELMARFTTDVIGACGFGLNMDCLSDENSQFKKLGKRIVDRSLRDAFAFCAKVLFPNIAKNITFFDPEIINSMNYLVQCAMKEKNFKPSGKNDFIDILLELKENGAKIIGESIEKRNLDGSPVMATLDIDDSIIVAQIFLLFTAGFETSSSTSSYTLHQLAFNPECQKRVQEEIDYVLAKHDNKICYEAINNMNYLRMAFSESMRIYPSLAHLVRMCTSEEYTIPEIGLTINKGVKVVIPNKALQNDEKYFEEPEKFKPERFDPEKSEVPNFTYMPFGEGPRACVGARLGQMQALAGLVAVLQKFTVEPADCTIRNPPPDPTGFVSESFIGGLPLKLRKRY